MRRQPLLDLGLRLGSEEIYASETALSLVTLL